MEMEAAIRVAFGRAFEGGRRAVQEDGKGGGRYDTARHFICRTFICRTVKREDGNQPNAPHRHRLLSPAAGLHSLLPVNGRRFG